MFIQKVDVSGRDTTTATLQFLILGEDAFGGAVTTLIFFESAIEIGYPISTAFCRMLRFVSGAMPGLSLTAFHTVTLEILSASATC